MDVTEVDKANRPSKTWDFTINNYTEADIAFIQNLDVSRIVASKEVGESGTPHIQGKVTFKRAYRFTALKKLHPGAHWERSLVTNDFNYCKKIDSEIIRNENNAKQGKRTDLEKVVEEIKKKEFDHFCPEYIKYHGGIDKLENEIFENNIRSDPPTVIWLYGETGVGKTKFVFENHEPKDIYSKDMSNGKWWDGYKQQKVVLFDDMRKDTFKFHELLRILDRYPLRVEKKGSSIQFNSPNIYITSCFSPDELYETREDLNQLKRRISKVIHLKKDKN